MAKDTKRTTSAKPLFRAMKGSKDTASALFGKLPVQDKPQELRRELDFYATGETDAIRALLAVDGPRIRALGRVWEPACGAGDMVKVIRGEGLPCVASDLIHRDCPDSWLADYFEVPSALAPAVITNPPYDQINARDGRGRWLKHAARDPAWRYMALLLSWEWPAAVQNGLGAAIDANPFSYCYLMRWKIDFTGQGSPPQRNAWFVWDRDDPRSLSGSGGPHPEPGFRLLDRCDDRQSALALV
jgi:hypothetical protein